MVYFMVYVKTPRKNAVISPNFTTHQVPSNWEPETNPRPAFYAQCPPVCQEFSMYDHSGEMRGLDISWK